MSYIPRSIEPLLEQSAQANREGAEALFPRQWPCGASHALVRFRSNGSGGYERRVPGELRHSRDV